MNKILSSILLLSFFSSSFAQPTVGVGKKSDKNKYSNNQIFTGDDMYTRNFHDYLIYDTKENKSILINGYDGVLTCYDMNYKKKWSFKPEDTARLSNGRNQFYYADGVLFTAYMTGYVYALNAFDGSKLWDAKVGLDHEELHFTSQNLKPFKNKIFLVSRKNNNVYAVDSSNGELEWNYSLPSPHSYVPYTTLKDVIYFNNDPYISSFDSNSGKPLQQVNFNSNMAKSVSTDKYVIMTNDRDKKISALSPLDFKPVWEFQLDKDFSTLKKNIFVEENKVYFGSKSGKNLSTVISLDGTTGKLLWKTEIPGELESMEIIKDEIYGNTSERNIFIVSLKKGDLKNKSVKYQPVSNFQKQGDDLYFYAKEGLIKFNLKSDTETLVIKYDGKSENRMDAQIKLTNVK